MTSFLGKEEWGRDMGFSSFWKFFWNFWRSPQQIGGLFPSSRVLARAIAGTAQSFLLDSSPLIVEVGPGTGALTRELNVTGIPLILLERDISFYRDLRRRFPELKIICEDFLKTSLFDEVNRGAVIVSSLPLRSLEKVEVFTERFRDLLLSGKVRAVIQYSYGLRDPLSIQDRRVEVRREKWILWNLPPAFIWSYRLK